MHVVIIGNGISGTTAARFIRKQSKHKITMISAESATPYSRTALMYIFMGHVPLEQTYLYSDYFYDKNNINRILGKVSSVDFERKILHFDPHFSSSDFPPPGPTLEYDMLIIATGSVPNKFGWPGQDLKNVRGMYTLQDIDAIDKASPQVDHAVIVGGGLIGIELAEMFHSRNKKVTLLVRESSYWNNVLPPEESELVNQQILSHGIDLQLNTELNEIKGNNGYCSSVTTSNGEEIPCQFVGLTAGVSPNVDFLRNSPLNIDKGVLVDDTLQTNIPDVYAIGDCAQIQSPNPDRRAIEAVWYTGKMMGEIAAYNICGSEKKYNPGIWFNSAKFFDLEYQVYGHVPPVIASPYHSFYWESPQKNQSIRIIYKETSETVVGFNLMGVRFRQELCEQWIKNETRLHDVVKHLPAAFFDPELYASLTNSVAESYREQTGRDVHFESKKGLKALRLQMRKLLKIK